MGSTYLLADRQDITREGITSLLRQQDRAADIIAVGCCNELRELIQQHSEVVVVLDYTLFDFSSVNQLLNMRAGAQNSSWLLFSDELGEAFLRRVLLSNLSFGVVMKQDKSAEIAEALRTASVGGAYLCELAKSALEGDVFKVAEANVLTATEKAILREIALGKMTKEIAWEKNLSFHTVNTHRKNIYRKLEVNNVQEATKYALQAGLIELMEYYI